MPHLSLAIVLLALALAFCAKPAPAQQAPAPLFEVEPVNAVCGALSDHARLLEREGWGEVWRGTTVGEAGIRIWMAPDGHWSAFLVMGTTPPQACALSDGIASQQWAPPGE